MSYWGYPSSKTSLLARRGCTQARKDIETLEAGHVREEGEDTNNLSKSRRLEGIKRIKYRSSTSVCLCPCCWL